MAGIDALSGLSPLAALDPETMVFLIPIVSILVVFAIPITAIITEHAQKKKKMEIVEKAIERGVPIEELDLKFDEAKQRLPYRSGMINVAIGLGVVIFGMLMSMGMQQAGESDYMIPRFVFAGGGAIVVLIGLALLANDFMNRDRMNGNGKS